MDNRRAIADGDHIVGLADFGEAAVDELLPSETWVYGHDEDQVEVFDDVFQNTDGGVRIQCNTCFTASGFNLLYYPVKVVGCFGVDGDAVRSGLGKALDVAARLVDHQVNVEVLRRVLRNLLDDELAEGDVGDEVAVHHIEVEPVGFAFIDEFYGLVESAKIGG